MRHLSIWPIITAWLNGCPTTDAQDSFEYVDVQNNLETCGGCMGCEDQQGRDYSTIENAATYCCPLCRRQMSCAGFEVAATPRKWMSALHWWISLFLTFKCVCRPGHALFGFGGITVVINLT